MNPLKEVSDWDTISYQGFLIGDGIAMPKKSWMLFAGKGGLLCIGLTFSCFWEGFGEAFADAVSILLHLLAFLCARCLEQLNKVKIVIFLVVHVWFSFSQKPGFYHLSQLALNVKVAFVVFAGFLSGIQDLLNNCLKDKAAVLFCYHSEFLKTGVFLKLE